MANIRLNFSFLFFALFCLNNFDQRDHSTLLILKNIHNYALPIYCLQQENKNYYTYYKIITQRDIYFS